MHCLAAPASLVAPHSLSVRQSWKSPAAQAVLQLVECAPHSRGWQHTALVQSAASSHGSVMPLVQPAVKAVHVPPPPSAATQHCCELVSQVVLPHVTIIGSLGAPPSGTGTAVAPLLEPGAPSPVTPPPSPPELLPPCTPLLAPSTSASSSPPLEFPPLLVPPLLPLPPPLLVWPPLLPLPPLVTLLALLPEQCVRARGATDSTVTRKARREWVVLIG